MKAFLAQFVAVGGGGGQEAERLQKRVAELEDRLFNCLGQITEYEQELKQLRRAQRKGTPHTGSLKRTRAEIAAKMRAFFGDARLSVLSDREIARLTGLSPQTVGNWRRRLEAERAASRRTVHNGQDLAGRSPARDALGDPALLAAGRARLLAATDPDRRGTINSIPMARLTAQVPSRLNQLRETSAISLTFCLADPH